MADRRGTDLTYGHLGEATYDTVEQKWSFSRMPVLRKSNIHHISFDYWLISA
jgi:hypothetical protein